jgi:hypothetical protein
MARGQRAWRRISCATSTRRTRASATWYLNDPSKKGTVYALVALSFTVSKTERR